MISKLVRTKQWNARAVIALLPCVVKNVLERKLNVLNAACVKTVLNHHVE